MELLLGDGCSRSSGGGIGGVGKKGRRGRGVKEKGEDKRRGR